MSASKRVKAEAEEGEVFEEESGQEDEEPVVQASDKKAENGKKTKVGQKQKKGEEEEEEEEEGEEEEEDDKEEDDEDDEEDDSGPPKDLEEPFDWCPYDDTASAEQFQYEDPSQESLKLEKRVLKEIRETVDKVTDVAVLRSIVTELATAALVASNSSRRMLYFLSPANQEESEWDLLEDRLDSSFEQLGQEAFEAASTARDTLRRSAGLPPVWKKV